MSGFCHVFVGPSAYGLPSSLLLQSDIIVHPPAQRGSIDDLRPDLGPGHSIALVDGRFGDVPAVGHKEIMSCLDAHVPVWGLGSIGAIRAAEMHVYGMRAFGDVASAFISDPEMADDEVVLSHLPVEPYTPVSEPMVHLRGAVRALEQQKIVDAETATLILRQLKERWFGERTWTLLSSLLQNQGVDAIAAEAVLASPQIFRTKARDVQHFLEVAPWRHL